MHGPVRDAQGNITTPGDVILIAHDLELDKEISSTLTQVHYYEDKLRADESNDPALSKIDHYQLDAVQNKLNELSARRDKLTLRAPINGQVVSPQLKDMVGRYIKQGEEIALVMDPTKLNVRVLLEQNQVGVITRKDRKNPDGGPKASPPPYVWLGHRHRTSWRHAAASSRRRRPCHRQPGHSAPPASKRRSTRNTPISW